MDNNGAHMDFTGGWDGHRMTLGRTIDRDGMELRQRMVFRDITADALTWDWEASTDGGETWETKWRIDYERREEAASSPAARSE